MDKYSREILFSVPRGMNAGLAPPLLEATQASSLLNCTLRGGLTKTRPKFSPFATATPLPSGRFQGAFVYRLQSGDRMLFCVSGTVYSLRIDTGDITAIASFPTTDFPTAYFCQADRYAIIQNGIYDPVENWPIIIHEDTIINNLDTQVVVGTGNVKKVSELSYPEAKRVPIGKAMAFGHGRLFVAVDRVFDDGSTTGASPMWKTGLGTRFILAGDVIKPDNIQELLAFTENEYWNDGGAMGPPAELGFITSMGFFRNSASGTGLGALVVMSREGCSAFSVNVRRAQWKNTDISQVLFFNSGSDSPYSLISINSDLVYRGRDGLRTIQYTAANEGSGAASLYNTPYSTEVSSFFERDSRDILPAVYMSYADNRIFTTSGGSRLSDGSVVFDSLVVLNTAVLTSSESAPLKAYEGIWTGPQFYASVSARLAGWDYIFLITRDRDTGAMGVSFITDDAAYDGTEDRPVSRVYTKEYLFGSHIVVKRIKLVDMWFSNIRTDLDVTVYWRRAGETLWHRLGSQSVKIGPTSLPLSVSQMRLVFPDDDSPDGCDPYTQQPFALGNTFQFCVEWVGDARHEKTVFAVAELSDVYSQELHCDDEALSLSESTDSVALSDFTVYQI